jgi:hypothetical protein
MDAVPPHSHPSGLTNRMFAARHCTGRLVEAWALRFDSASDVAMFGMQSSQAIAEVAGHVVICSDYSNLQSLPSDVLPSFVDVLRRANPRLDRAALVMPRQGTTLRHQMEGMLRRAIHPNRRLCADSAEAKAWLSSLLSREEQLRLDEFLRERSMVDPAMVAEVRRAAPIVPAGPAGHLPPSTRRRRA